MVGSHLALGLAAGDEAQALCASLASLSSPLSLSISRWFHLDLGLFTLEYWKRFVPAENMPGASLWMEENIGKQRAERA